MKGWTFGGFHSTIFRRHQAPCHPPYSPILNLDSCGFLCIPLSLWQWFTPPSYLQTVRMLLPLKTTCGPSAPQLPPLLAPGLQLRFDYRGPSQGCTDSDKGGKGLPQRRVISTVSMGAGRGHIRLDSEGAVLNKEDKT